MSTEGAIKYDRQIDIQGQSSAAQILRWIRQGSKVLEMGPATGIMTKWLSGAMNCEVTCVEVDPQAAKIAEPFCKRMVVADLERDNWSESLSDICFDYIVFADVLEHLRDPLAVLKRAMTLLAPAGEILISIPNIAYSGVVGELLEGRFDYRRDGLLDDTHVRFFTRRSLERMLADAGLGSLEWSRTVVAPEFSEFKLNTNRYGSFLKQALTSMPDGDTYQFLVRCAPGVIESVSAKAAPSMTTSNLASFQVFFDRGSGFSELDSATMLLRGDAQWQRIKFKIPANTRALRVDPIDIQRMVTISELRVELNGSDGWNWTPADGELAKVARLDNLREHPGRGSVVLVPQNDDPGFYVEVDAAEGGEAEVCLRLGGDDALAEYLEDLRSAQIEYQAEIVKQRGSISDLELKLSVVESDLRAGETERDDLKQRLGQLEIERAQLVESLNGIVRSKSWRLTKPLRWSVRLLKVARNIVVRSLRASLRRFSKGYPNLLGFQPFSKLLVKTGAFDPFELVCLRREPSDIQLAKLRQAESSSVGSVKFSIIMPTYKTNPAWLKTTIQSVLSQTYPNWELCVVDDASDSPGIRSLLSAYSQSEPRLKVKYLDQNGHISRASNVALEIATGSYVVLLDHDDLLAPQALSRLAQTIQANPKVDVIYSDEDKVDSAAKRYEPTFKPAWSRDYFMSFMFTGHISCFRTELMRDVGGFREGFEGSQDYDLMLRITERTDAIQHIPEILYHWRAHGESVAANPDSKPYAYQAAKKALGEAVRRQGHDLGVVRDSSSRGLYIVDRGAQASCAGVFLVETTQSEANRAGCYYVRDSAEGVSELLRQVKELPGEVVVISSISNLDRTVIERLLDWTSDSGIGLAAPALVSGQGSFLSVGMCEPRGEPEHNFNGVAADAMGYRGRLRVPFNVSSVAPGLFVVRRELLVSAPSDFVDIAELVYYLSSLAISRGKRVVVDPTLRVRIDPQLLGASIAGARARELRGLAGIERSGDPYFPRGLVSYLNCDRMPDS